MSLPSWGQLLQNFCSKNKKDNPYYEDFANRRYNYAANDDKKSCRLIFLKDVLNEEGNKTLRRRGRFIWCRKLRYEGKNADGFREISFTIDKGAKRFQVAENNILCIPSTLCVSNHRYFKSKHKTFYPFSSVFSYKKTLNMMRVDKNCSTENFKKIITADSPFKPGTLVQARRGYFFPEINIHDLNKPNHIHVDDTHPCGIILGPAFVDSGYVSKEFYRVSFGDTIYEKVHPVQMEIINEI